MNKIFSTALIVFICSLSTKAQQKTQIQPIPQSFSTSAFTEGCSLFTDPNSFSTGSTFSYNAPINNNSNLTGASGTNYGCMGSVPNQAWFIITVTTGGNLYFNFTNSNGYDIDAVVWGPLAGNNVANACTSTQNSPITCDYDASRPDLYINGAVAGQKYIMLVTNFSNANTVINISQPTGGSVNYAMVNLPNCSLVPSASISGTSTTISEGQSATLNLNFTGSSPWNYRLSDGTIGTTYSSSLSLNVFPIASQTYTINSVNNLCGTSGGTGSVGVSVSRNVALKSCLPLDGNATDAQGLNNGTLQNGVAATTNRASEANKALQFDGVDDYISLPTNQLNNNTFAFTAWLKLDELPDLSNPERIAFSLGVSGNEHYLASEFYNGSPAWKFSSNGTDVYSNAVVDLNWHLIIGVRTGGLIKIYVDGVLTGTQTVSGIATYGSSLSGRIGSGIANNKFFKGKIDDVKIFNQSLIEPEILLLQNYNSCNNVFNDTYLSVQSISTSVICTGSSFLLNAFSNNILPDGQLQFVAELSDASGSFSSPTNIGSSPFLPLSVTVPSSITGGNYKLRLRYGGLISVNAFDVFVNNPATYNINGTVSLNDGQSTNLSLNFTGTGPWSYIMSNGLSGNATTTPWQITVTPDQSITYSVSSAQNVCGNSSINGSSSAVVSVNYTKQFVTCLPFAGNATDTKANNTTTVNGPILALNRFGQVNTAYEFNGTSNHINYTTNLLRKREFTMSAWVLANSISGSTQYIISQGEIGTQTFQGIGVNSSGWFFQSYGGFGSYTAFSSNSLAANQWVHLTAVRTYQSLKLYVNGNLVSTTSNSSQIPFKESDIGRIGASSSTLGNFFNGKIDDVRLFKGALNDDEVFGLFANSTDCPTVENASIVVARGISPASVCAGNNVSLSYTSSNTIISPANPLTVQLSDVNGSFASPTSLGTGFASPITVVIPANTVNSNFYRVRLVTSGGAVNSVNSSNLTVSGSLPTATISGGGSIPFGGSSSVSIAFTGTAPYTFALNNGSSQTTSSNPATVSVSPFGTTTYTITSLSNTCGTGIRMGNAVVNVEDYIGINVPSFQVCKGQSFTVPITSNITSLSSNFNVELSNNLGLFNNNVIIIGSGQGSQLTCIIPNNINLGTYKIRVKYNSSLSNEVTTNLNSVPTATISGNYEVEDGTDVTIPIYFQGKGPYTYNLNNGYSGINLTDTLLYYYAKPKVDRILTITSLSNSCGSGITTGGANIDVIYVKKLISCFNLNNNVSDQIGSNSGVIFGNPLSTTDRFGNANSALQFNGINDYIQFPINGLENQNYTYSAWVQPYSMPFANSSQETSYRSIVSVGSLFRQHALYSYYYHYNGYPAWRVNSTRAYYVSSQNQTPVVNQWYHISMVSNENDLKLYINGNLIGSSTHSQNDPENTYYSNSIGMIGAQNWAGLSRFFHGKIDDVRIFRGALSTNEIQTLYNSTGCSDVIIFPKITINNFTTSPICQGNIIPVDFSIENLNLTQPLKLQLSDEFGSFTSPLQIGSGITSPISASIPNNIIGQNYKIRIVSSDNTIISSITPGFSINSQSSVTLSGSTIINEGESANLVLNFSGTAPYTYSLTGGTSLSSSLTSIVIPVFPLVNTTYSVSSISNTCGAGTSTGSAVITVTPVPIRLVSCFPFYGNANDSKGLNNGTVYGATLTTDRFGNPNSAYSFDGDDKIQIGTNNIKNTNYSISIWFNLFSTQSAGNYLYSIGSTNHHGMYYFQNLNYINSEGPATGSYTKSTNNLNPILNSWYHLTLTRNDNAIKIYLNGTLNAEGTVPFNSQFDANPVAFLGSAYFGNGYFFGKLDDFQIYKGALTAGQVQALYQNTNPCFDATTYTCLSDNLFTTMLSGQQTLQVSNQIIGRSTVQSSSNIHFDSKNSILLEPGFKTEGNTIFKATVGGGCQ